MTRRARACAAVLAGPAVATLFATVAALPPRPRLLWNASASAPVGLYSIDPVGKIAAADLVAIEPPGPLATFLANRGYLPKGLPLLKHIAAMAGQRVCRIGLAILVDGVRVGDALPRDRAGRQLPAWHGCQRVPVGQVFLMNPAVRDSFDGRYFGLVPASQIIGRARPLWTETREGGRSVSGEAAR